MPLMAALLAFIVWTVIKGTTSKYVGFATTKSGSSSSSPSSPAVPSVPQIAPFGVDSSNPNSYAFGA